MFCRVYNADDGTVIMINPKCNMKLIYEYLRVMTEIPDSNEIDLCTENGRFLGIYEAECTANGLDYFVPRSDYFIFIFDYDETTGDLYNPQPAVPYSSDLFSPVLRKMKKFFGIPKSEAVNQEDAALLFEHMLIAYQEKLSPVEVSTRTSAASIATNAGGDVPSGKKNSRTKSIFKSNANTSGQSIFQLWREEKRAALMAARSEAEEGEESTGALGAMVARKLSRMSLSLKKNNQSGINEEEEGEATELNVAEPTKTYQPTKKASKKKSEKPQAKKAQDGEHKVPPKEKEKLQQAAPAVKASLSNNYKLLEPSCSFNSFDSIRQFYTSQPVVLRDRSKPPPASSKSEMKADKKGKGKLRRKIDASKRGKFHKK